MRYFFPRTVWSWYPSPRSPTSSHHTSFPIWVMGKVLEHCLTLLLLVFVLLAGHLLGYCKEYIEFDQNKVKNHLRVINICSSSWSELELRCRCSSKGLGLFTMGRGCILIDLFCRGLDCWGRGLFFRRFCTFPAIVLGPKLALLIFFCSCTTGNFGIWIMRTFHRYSSPMFE